MKNESSGRARNSKEKKKKKEKEGKKFVCVYN
jgi:hypothetical protein